ncbi:helix-turn-helix transcriptional regulator [Streptomyces sp. NPDC004610]|uniref:helix-turn-helix domain-containing protein n=1 Tax=unclassified Streptomyces TaxID=2593676 RepID=UPI0033A1241D
MAAHPRPTVRRRKLGSELRRLREAAKVGMDDAGAAIDGDKTKISRIENGRQGIRPLEIKELCKLYSVADERVVTALLTLARESRKKSWWQQYSDVLSPDFQQRLALETDAVRIYAFHTMVIPGLLQTREYAEAVIRGSGRHTPDLEIETSVNFRMERQAIFDRPEAPQYVCVLDEAVLHREVGSPRVMSQQLRHLVDAAGRPGVGVQIVPYSQGPYAGFEGPFTIYSYPDPMELDVVGLEYLEGALYLEEGSPVEAYRRSFDHIRAAALSSRQSMELISRIARDHDAK